MNMIHRQPNNSRTVDRKVQCAPPTDSGLLVVLSAVDSSIRASICTLQRTERPPFSGFGCNVRRAAYILHPSGGQT